MGTTATTIGKSSGTEEDSVPAWMVNLRGEVDRKYKAWCQRRGLNPLDLHDRGENSMTMRQAIANQARAAVRRLERARNKGKGKA